MKKTENTNFRKIYNRWHPPPKDKLTAEQRYRLRHPEKCIQSCKNSWEKAKNKVNLYFGNVCWNCNRENVELNRHEINGISHDNVAYGFYWRNRKRFIRLCTKCHCTFHLLMEFGYSFEEILKIFKWEIIYE